MKEESSLPRYKSNEYSPKFQASWETSPHLKKFKHDGELSSATEISLRRGGWGIHVIWKRKTWGGTEKVEIGYIVPTEIFLEFLDDLIGRVPALFGRKSEWKTRLGVIETACRVAEEDHDHFKEIVRSVDTLEEFEAHAAIA